MAKCKKCGKEFHACPSCGLTYSYEYSYCNEWCWEDSEEFKNNKQDFEDFYNTLSLEQRSIFGRLANNVFGDSDYEYKIENWIKELDK
jgi:hypothetical protein